MGIVLPAVPNSGGNYVPAKTAGQIVYLAGVISSNSGGVITGTAGLDRTIDEGYAAARACALTQLAVKGWRDYLNDPTAAHAMIAKLNPALNPEWMRFTWQALRDGRFVTGDDPGGAQLGQMTSERWTTMYKQLYDLKVIDKAFDPATAYTLRFSEKQSN